MERRFEHKVALVTGAASGIGKAVAQRLAAEGAVLVLADINEAGLHALHDELREQFGEECAVPVLLDVSKASECKAAVQTAVDRFGGLDVLANIAGIAMTKHVADYSEEDWQRIVGINLNGVFFMSQAAMPYLLQRKGCIVNMASTAGLQGQAYNAAYCATKAAVVMMTKSMALEFAKQGVRVNAVCPGAVLTPLVANFSIPEDADMSLVERLFPLVEAAMPEEIATAVAYLASEDARYINGHALAIDGAQTAG